MTTHPGSLDPLVGTLAPTLPVSWAVVGTRVVESWIAGMVAQEFVDRSVDRRALAVQSRRSSDLSAVDAPVGDPHTRGGAARAT